MNSRLLISLLALQVVSVAHAFDPGFYDVEYTGPHKLRRDIRNVKDDLSRRKRWGEWNATDLAYMKTPQGQMSYYGSAQKDLENLQKAGGSGWDIRQAKWHAERSLADYEKYRQSLQKSVDTLDADVTNMEARLANLKAQVRAQGFGSTRRGRPFTQRVRSWFSNWYK